MKTNLNHLGVSTICAPATVEGSSAIAVIRISGPDAISIADGLFVPAKGLNLAETKGNRIRFGTIEFNGKLIDEVLVSVFRTPHSFTGEDSVEIACHGSVYIQKEIIKLLIKNGAKAAKPGEFSQRAFLNGKMDLAQAEAVADLIMAETEASHKVALMQMRGGFSMELRQMRSELLEIVSLMELELDFSDEDVEFADRGKLKSLLNNILNHVSMLIDSFDLGNVIKNGVPVAIAGATNTGKSTLLNSILGEERAIVSDIHGTTRDFIEDVININGTIFRFIDTAGIRNTNETIEKLGIERTFEKIKSAAVVLLMLDAERPEQFENSILQLSSKLDHSKQKFIILVNKSDICQEISAAHIEDICAKNGLSPTGILLISAKLKNGLVELKELLAKTQAERTFDSNATLVTNMRHLEALIEAKNALDRVLLGLEEGLPTDLLTQDIREAMFHIGEITGEINTEEILGNIFSKFCIGK